MLCTTDAFCGPADVNGLTCKVLLQSIPDTYCDIWQVQEAVDRVVPGIGSRWLEEPEEKIDQLQIRFDVFTTCKA